MTNEEAAAILESMKNYFLPTSPMLEERREITALDLAISALSKQSASCEQADHIAEPDKMVKLKKRTITERLIIAESLINSVIADSDQFREATKKTDFKPGDKFILELGQERRMFGEFEIKGTDLYVRTDLLEKLKRYEPEENAIADKILIDLEEAIETVKFECGEWKGLAKTIVNGLKKLSPKQFEKIPYKKPEIINCKDCRYRDPEDKKCDHGHGIVWQLPRPDGWFCADGKR